jgi:hypothetical protein
VSPFAFKYQSYQIAKHSPKSALVPSLFGKASVAIVDNKNIRYKWLQAIA